MRELLCREGGTHGLSVAYIQWGTQRTAIYTRYCPLVTKVSLTLSTRNGLREK